MSVDLKRQASDLYKQRDDVKTIRTSEALSVNRIIYASLGIVVLALIAVQMFGGFSRRTDPIEAAMTAPKVVKEAPPPELLQEPAAPSVPAEPAQPQTKQSSPQSTPPPQPIEAARVQAPVPSPPPVIAKPRPEPAAPPAAADERPARQTGPKLVREKQPAQVAASKPAKRESVESKTPPPPQEPVISPVEQARRQLARDIVLEGNSALLALLAGPENKGWQADPVNTDQYNVVFNIVDKASGTTVQYIWRVNLSTRTSTPLSYYARKLS